VEGLEAEQGAVDSVEETVEAGWAAALVVGGSAVAAA